VKKFLWVSEIFPSFSNAFPVLKDECRLSDECKFRIRFGDKWIGCDDNLALLESTAREPVHVIAGATVDYEIQGCCHQRWEPLDWMIGHLIDDLRKKDLPVTEVRNPDQCKEILHRR
jgi:hypothetical protein